MLYDLANQPPEPGSLLESVFLLLTNRRREAEICQTEAIVVAILGSKTGQVDIIENAMKSYKNALFPFLEAEKSKREDMAISYGVSCEASLECQ
jgi:hypothetical protein